MPQRDSWMAAAMVGCSSGTAWKWQRWLVVCMLNSGWGFELHWFVVKSPNYFRMFSLGACKYIDKVSLWFLCFTSNEHTWHGNTKQAGTSRGKVHWVFSPPKTVSEQKWSCSKLFIITAKQITLNPKTSVCLVPEKIGCLAQKPHYSTSHQSSAACTKTDRSEKLQATSR